MLLLLLPLLRCWEPPSASFTQLSSLSLPVRWCLVACVSVEHTLSGHSTPSWQQQVRESVGCLQLLRARRHLQSQLLLNCWHLSLYSPKLTTSYIT